MAQSITRWSELAGFIADFQTQMQATANEPVRIFAYGSLINNHKDIKPDSIENLPNEEVTLEGMEVAMNVYAKGPYSFRGTWDEDAGIMNVGLYAGLEPALEADGFAQGVAITVPQDHFRASFEAFANRELGTPPYPEFFDDLFTPGRSVDTSRIDEAQDMFGLYTLHAIDVTRADGVAVPALTVATNPKSPLAAVGISPLQAAYHIFTGQGYARPSANGETTIGGSALDYFRNVMQSYRDADGNTKFHHPRMEAIEAELDRLMRGYSKAYEALMTPDLNLIRLAASFRDIADELQQDGKEGLDTLPEFPEGAEMKRDPVDEDTKIRAQEEMAKNALEHLQRAHHLIQSLDQSNTAAIAA